MEKNLTTCQLGKAYRRAGASFKGQLHLNFVVLNERSVVLPGCELVNAGAVGAGCCTSRKHLREEMKTKPK
jgi:hypothetical protein